MTKRIQAYFRTEDDAEGAKTALIGYKADGLDVWALTDPLGNDRNLLVPLLPVNNLGGISTGTAPASYGAAPAAYPAVVAAAGGEAVDGTSRNNNSGIGDGRTQAYDDADLGDLRYVMEIKASDDDFDAVVHTLRSKNGYVEVFE
ncbi:hypothetical protein KIH86_08625 [Paenibacillus sp. HN-1]|uniref:hypothetical protein n=1 Tax=Paenibacillus TaxID=44249 RepID=UPI001CA96D61|nr:MULTISPECIES: hypothetical protein [Paenibacillus]MBY9079615.1 hypothetical protein [Paenibacillus sp. CGMCC 1.18879]MBY9084304.1 hypothetical protein [Paenibacillus sinensis]